jgi:hypothetical protein
VSLPTTHDIFAWTPPKVATSFTRLLEWSTAYRVALLENHPAQDGDEIVYDGILLEAGLYTIEYEHFRNSQCGIADVYLDGVLIGSVDAYAEQNTPNARSFFTDVAISEGFHELKLKVNGKNPKADQYYGSVQAIGFRKQGSQPKAPVGYVPRAVDIDPMREPSRRNGFGTLQPNSNQVKNGWRRSDAATDEIAWDVTMDAGTWSLHLIVLTYTLSPILDVHLDGVRVGSIDLYAGGLGWNTQVLLAGIVVASAGVHELRFKVPTKNPASDGHRAYLTTVSLRRTGP